MDVAGRVWTISAARMKAKCEHRVPLCGRAVEILEAARALGDGDLVFPMRSGKPIGMSTLPKMLEYQGIAAVAHGFRSSFRDWAAEETDHPREVIEAALAHVVQNKVEAAYARSDLFEQRRRLMNDWEAYLAESRRPQPPVAVMPGGRLALGRYEVTVGEYRSFASTTGGGSVDCLGDSWHDPGFPQTDRHPVTCVSWVDAQEYVSWLSRTAGVEYRLPTEREWESAAAGSQRGCDRERTGIDGTCPVGTYGTNAAGLSDMVGSHPADQSQSAAVAQTVDGLERARYLREWTRHSPAEAHWLRLARMFEAIAWAVAIAVLIEDCATRASTRGRRTACSGRANGRRSGLGRRRASMPRRGISTTCRPRRCEWRTRRQQRWPATRELELSMPPARRVLRSPKSRHRVRTCCPHRLLSRCRKLSLSARPTPSCRDRRPSRPSRQTSSGHPRRWPRQ